MRTRWSVYLLLGTVTPALACLAEVWYVNNANLSATEDGKSWATAFKTVQPAIDLAGTAGGGEVWVAKGLYRETRSNLFENVNTGSLALRPNVTLLGGFAGNEIDRDQRNARQNPTVISGKTARDGNPAYHVVIGAENTVIDGFTIRDGMANGERPFNKQGGGLFCRDVNMTVKNCVVEFCGAENSGGGILGWDSKLDIIATAIRNNRSDYVVTEPEEKGGGAGISYQGTCNATPEDTLRVESCAFENNVASGRGGGLYVRMAKATVLDSRFDANSAKWGGGFAAYTDSSASFTNTTFTKNNAESGGGIRLAHRTTGDVWKCNFQDNTSSGAGGGIAFYHAGAGKIGNSTFSNNKSTRYSGGAVRALNTTVNIAATEFSGNTALAGGMLSSEGSAVFIDRCTIVGNTPIAILAVSDKDKITGTNNGFGNNGDALYKLEYANQTFHSVQQLAQSFPNWQGNRAISTPPDAPRPAIAATAAPRPQTTVVRTMPVREKAPNNTHQDREAGRTIFGIYVFSAIVAAVFIIAVVGLLYVWQKTAFRQMPTRVAWPDE